MPRIAGDSFESVCQFHDDCLEGLASGYAIRRRYGCDLRDLADDARLAALALIGGYLATALRSLIYLAAPGRVILAGGVGLAPGLLEAVNRADRQIGHGYGLFSVCEPRDVLCQPNFRKEAGALAGAALAFMAFHVSRWVRIMLGGDARLPFAQL